MNDKSRCPPNSNQETLLTLAKGWSEADQKQDDENQRSGRHFGSKIEAQLEPKNSNRDPKSNFDSTWFDLWSDFWRLVAHEDDSIDDAWLVCYKILQAVGYIELTLASLKKVVSMV